jgi:DNA-binding NarL/FixJ family response regulator
MKTLCVVLYQNDPGTAQTLGVSLSQHFDSVHLARSYEEVFLAVTRQRADVLVLDLETSGAGEVERLHHEFPSLCIVGTHRLADDELWTDAVNHGASDICVPRQDDVVRSVLHSVSHGLTHHAAA